MAFFFPPATLNFSTVASEWNVRCVSSFFPHTCAQYMIRYGSMQFGTQLFHTTTDTTRLILDHMRLALDVHSPARENIAQTGWQHADSQVLSHIVSRESWANLKMFRIRLRPAHLLYICCFACVKQHPVILFIYPLSIIPFCSVFCLKLYLFQLHPDASDWTAVRLNCTDV